MHNIIFQVLHLIEKLAKMFIHVPIENLDNAFIGQLY